MHRCYGLPGLAAIALMLLLATCSATGEGLEDGVKKRSGGAQKVAVPADSRHDDAATPAKPSTHEAAPTKRVGTARVNDPAQPPALHQRSDDSKPRNVIRSDGGKDSDDLDDSGTPNSHAKLAFLCISIVVIGCVLILLIIGLYVPMAIKRIRTRDQTAQYRALRLA
ncbi:uncharacterized protein LOC135829676 [Sycon ciliatum]|uniref:uncharacterized protein LOC135829676 n=1 Tax=Sycon ciliatum TaxID=27933 RepID=UPI0031F5F214